MTTTDSMADTDTNGSWRNWLGRHLRLEGQDEFEIDLPRLDLRLALVPAQTSLGFAKRSSALDDAASGTADRLATMLRERPGPRVIVPATQSGGIAAERAAAVRDALIARGVPEPAIAMTASDTVPADEIVVVIEKPPPF